VAASASGISVYGERLFAFVLSAALVALGGVMQGHFVGTLTTTGNTYFNFQFIALAMLVVGGMRSLSGAVVGVVLLSVLSEILRRFENGVTVVSLDIQFPAGLREVGLGLVMLAILIYRPRGLFGDSELSMAPLIRRLWSAARSTQHAPRAAIDDRSN
jgi:branched-chain amino acid transport system permease protein